MLNIASVENELSTENGLSQSRSDMRKSTELMGREEIRYLVDSYYQVQEFRKASSNMRLALQKDEQPANFVSWVSDSQMRVEKDIKIMLKYWVQDNPTGSWLLGIHGVAEVISAGLLAHVDINKAPTAGHIWNFAGLNPNQVWEKGKKRPWNAKLKRLCWIMGDCIVKTHNSDKSFYGPIYSKRKAEEVAKNENGDFAEQAHMQLKKRNVKDKDLIATYESGKLPAGQIELRARRIAVKLLLSHFHDVLHWNTFGTRAPEPYAIAILRHAHYIECPNAPWEKS